MNRPFRTLALIAIITVLLAISQHVRSVSAQQKPQTAAASNGADPALKLLGRMVGGVWATEGSFKAELKYEWRIPGKAIRGVGRAAIGTPQEFIMESLYGWDEASKKVYYMDFHGNDTVYKGLLQAEGQTLKGDFEGLIGDTGKYRFADTFTGNDTLSSAMFAKNRAGVWVKIHEMTFKRRRS
jgi:hypothetical protein